MMSFKRIERRFSTSSNLLDVLRLLKVYRLTPATSTLRRFVFPHRGVCETRVSARKFSSSEGLLGTRQVLDSVNPCTCYGCIVDCQRYISKPEKVIMLYPNAGQL